MSIYYDDEDQYLIDKVEEKARVERKSKSAVILSVLESYFEAEKKVGQILLDMEALSSRQLEEALEHQREEEDQEERLGEILLDKGYLRDIDLDRALTIQKEPKVEAANN